MMLDALQPRPRRCQGCQHWVDPEEPAIQAGWEPEGWSETRGRLSWLPCLIIRLIIQTIRRDPSGADQIDDPSNLSRPDRSGADQIDAEHQATDLAVGGSNPLRCANLQVRRY